MKESYMDKLSNRERNLEELADRSDTDLSDIPEIRAIPTGAEIGRFYRPKEQNITIRLDADLVAWLKTLG